MTTGAEERFEERRRREEEERRRRGSQQGQGRMPQSEALLRPNSRLGGRVRCRRFKPMNSG
jgi:hypothetical protein